MNRAETEDGSYASAQNRKLLAGLGLKPGENESAEPALNPCQTTAYAFFTGDKLTKGSERAGFGGNTANRQEERLVRHSCAARVIAAAQYISLQVR